MKKQIKTKKAILCFKHWPQKSIKPSWNSMKPQWKSKSKPRKQLKVSNTDFRKASSLRGIQWNPNEKANQSQESNLQFQTVTSEKQYASNLMNAQWKSKSKPRKQLKVSNTDLRKASSLRGIQWNPNEKANQNQESNLKFQVLSLE